MAELALQRVAKTFADGTVALDEIDLSFADGELTALLGPSGCGKTTLLRLVAGLDAPTRGTLRLDGEDITARPAHARGFGMVFQSFALFPHLNVQDNVAYALAIAGVDRRTRHARALELLELVRLAPLRERRIGELSGGQKQRVAIARALAQEPRLFLLDEPMSALDAQLREQMQVELRLLQQRLGITTIVVTHDQREAMSMADRIVVMSAGAVEQSGTPQDVYRRPRSRFVASFIGRTNLLDGVVESGGIMTGGARLEPTGGVAFLDGSRVSVGCRPERTVLHPADASGAHLLGARVLLVRDLGPTREIYLDADGAQLVCEAPSAADGPMSGEVRPGDEVRLEMPGDALRVYPFESAA